MLLNVRSSFSFSSHFWFNFYRPDPTYGKRADRSAGRGRRRGRAGRRNTFYFECGRPRPAIRALSEKCIVDARWSQEVFIFTAVLRAFTIFLHVGFRGDAFAMNWYTSISSNSKQLTLITSRISFSLQTEIPTPSVCKVGAYSRTCWSFLSSGMPKRLSLLPCWFSEQFWWARSPLYNTIVYNEFRNQYVIQSEN